MTRKVYLPLLALFLSGCSFVPGKSGISITTTPPSRVYINNQEIGTTPLNKPGLKPGEVTLKLVPEGAPPWEEKIKLRPGIETVITREFGPTESQSAGEIYELEKTNKSRSPLAIVSTPDAVTVRIDSQPQGFTPILLDNLSEGEHQIVLTSPGFRDRAISAKLQKGFKLTLNVRLSQDVLPPTPSPFPTTDPKITLTPTPKSATSSAKLSTTPTPKPTVKSSTTPTPSAKLTLTPPYVEILKTPTNFLRVRSDAGTTFPEVAQVNPGEKYAYLATKNDSNAVAWYQIEYQPGKKGYVISTYAKKVE